MGVAYDQTGSSLVHASSNGIWRAGERCPDIYLTAVSSGKPQRLYSIMSYGQTLFVSIGGHQGDDFKGKDNVKLLTILPASGREDGCVDSTATFRSDYVAQGEAFVVVVRPDLYIGYVGNQQEAGFYLRRI